MYLQITADHERDVAMPGESYTFGALADAQALGDLRALLAMGRRTARVRLKTGDTAAIKGLVDRLAW